MRRETKGEVVLLSRLRAELAMAPPLYPRRLRPRLDEALGDTPVVLLNGPRQSGKTTLVQQFADGAGRRYLTLDDTAP